MKKHRYPLRSTLLRNALVVLFTIVAHLLIALSIRFQKPIEKIRRCLPAVYKRTFAVERIVKIDDHNHTGEQFQCPVCGQQTSGSFTENYRETGACKHCGASNRFRQIALVINGIIGADDKRTVGCLNCTFQSDEAASNLAVYNTQCSGTLHHVLSILRYYQCSEYYGPQSKYGEVVDGVRNEDLQRLTFPDDKFDIVVSSEVFEHIPDPYKAHRQVLRILKQGACHVFSVPFIPHNLEDMNVASLDKDGKIVWTSEPMFHPDPIRKDGVPVFNIFGIQMLSKLCEMGFEVSYFRFHSISMGILGPNAFIFLACKG